MSHAFDLHANAVISRLHSRANDLAHRHDKQAETVMATHGIYDVCFQEIISYADKIAPDLGSVLRKIRATHTGLFQMLPGIVESAVGGATDTALSEVGAMQHELERSEEETGQLLEAAEMLESEAVRARAKHTSHALALTLFPSR